MPKIDTTPNKIKPYLFHGVNVTWQEGDKEATGDCPFCSRDGKFSINLDTGKYQCWVCKEVGNIYIFLCKLWELSDKATSNYQELATDRKLRNPDTLVHWELCRSITTGDWLVPGYSHDGKLQQLYRYVKNQERTLLMPTPTLGHKIFGVPKFDSKKQNVYLCEGPWDPQSLWEHLASHKMGDDGVLVETSNLDKSLLADANVLGVPTCTTFQEEWCVLFGGKNVNLMFDNDHPRVHPVTGKPIKPAALEGMKRVAGIMSHSKTPPSSIQFLKWGEQGYDLTLPSGYDVRDKLTG